MNDGIRVLSSLLLNHMSIRAHINMPGHVCQAVNCQDKTHTQTLRRMSADNECSSHLSTLLPGMRNLKGKVCPPCFRVPVWDMKSTDNIRQWKTGTIVLLFPSRQTCLQGDCSVLHHYSLCLLIIITTVFIFHSVKIKESLIYHCYNNCLQF